jgi:hypothetical protein
MSNNDPIPNEYLVPMYITFAVFLLILLGFSFVVGYLIWDGAN